MNLGSIILVALTCCVTIGVKQVEAGDQDESPASCQKYESIPAPKGDASTSALGSSAAKCDSESLYYGFDGPAQPIKARECAYRELGQGLPFGGEAILTMVYANGNGAQRNLDLALKFACEMDTIASAEKTYRVEHLEKLKADGWTGSNFDVCDDITSSYMTGFCEDKKDRIDEAELGSKLQTITVRWRPGDQQALALLERAAKRFFKARSENEVDLSGSMRAAFIIAENARLETSFVADIGRFERGDLPNPHADFTAADALLNSLYSKLMKSGVRPEMGTVTADGIRQTERLWIAYRDAWTKFGRTKYPATRAESWQTWATQQRIDQLKDMLPSK